MRLRGGSALLVAVAGFLPAQEPAPFADIGEHLELELDASAPPMLSGSATLRLTQGARAPLGFLLNRALRITSTRDQAGVALALTKGPALGRGFHEEARSHAVTFPDGTREIRITFTGIGATQTTRQDWMGILLLAADEIRMSRQSVFYPQIPRDLDGPAVAVWPSRVRVLVPRDFEAHVSGRPVPATLTREDARVFEFENARPSTLSFCAARRVRSEAKLGDAKVVVLLAEEHAHLAKPLVQEVERVLGFYADRFGAIGPRTLGIVEMHARAGTSYQWSAEGLITFDRSALGSGVPVASVAHEVAHLWWGQEVTPNGRGERFLTESLAEYSSWRYLAHRDGPAAVRVPIAAARRRWLAAVHEHGKECGLLDVRFSTPGYQALAYDHGPLALWSLHGKLGVSGVDAALRGYREAVTSRAARVRSAADAFVAAVRGTEGGAGADLRWLDHGGHLHLECRDVRFDGSRASLRCRVSPCPQQLPSRIPATIPVALWTAKGKTLTQITPGEELAEVRSDDGEILALELDPDRVLLGAEAPMLFAPSQAARIEMPRDATGDAARPVRAIPARATHATLSQDGVSLTLTIDGTAPGTRHFVRLPNSLRDFWGVPLPSLALEFTTRAPRARQGVRHFFFSARCARARCAPPSRRGSWSS